MIKLLIADDHKVLLDGFLSIFESHPNIEVVATASNGKEVLNLLKEVEIDIALLDINMPIVNGVEACKRIKAKYPATKVIALSMYRQKSYIKRMIQYGASGYLLKDDTTDEIKEAIELVHEGGKYFSKQISLENLDSPSPASSNMSLITPRELEILVHIAEGYSNKEIAKKLFISNHTVDSHRKNMLSKFQAKNAAELVKVATDKGLL